MPKHGFKAISLNIAIYTVVKKGMKKGNAEAGYRRYRSMAHFIEEAIISYKPGKAVATDESEDSE